MSKRVVVGNKNLIFEPGTEMAIRTAAQGLGESNILGALEGGADDTVRSQRRAFVLGRKQQMKARCASVFRLTKMEEPETLDTEMSGQTPALPAILAHSGHDTPIPTWKQVTRSVCAINSEMVGHLSRIVSSSSDEMEAVEVWDSWPGNVRRSVALLVDKIYHEGWLDSVGPIAGWPWDGGFFFSPGGADHRKLADLLDAKSLEAGVYTRCSLRDGLAAYLSGWNHPGWQRSWIENDSPFASLHVGLFKSGSAEVHLDLFNPIYINGAPPSDVIKLCGLGSYNQGLFGLHRRWEGSKHASVTRTSANFYHLMRNRVPLCF